MRAAPGIHVEWVEDEAVVLNEQKKEMHYLNSSSALIYALVLEYGMPRARDEALQRLQGPERQVHNDFDLALDMLVDKGILVRDEAR